MPNRYTIKGTLVAKKEGQYTQYVFKNLDEPDHSWDRYVMVTKCPNWQFNESMPVGITGFLTFEPVNAGTSYYSPVDETYGTYNYTSCYFINFVKEQEEDNNTKEFKF